MSSLPANFILMVGLQCSREVSDTITLDTVSWFHACIKRNNLIRKLRLRAPTLKRKQGSLVLLVKVDRNAEVHPLWNRFMM